MTLSNLRLAAALSALLYWGSTELLGQNETIASAWAREIPLDGYTNIGARPFQVETLVLNIDGTFTRTKTIQDTAGTTLGDKIISGGSYEIEGNSIILNYIDAAIAGKEKLLTVNDSLVPIDYPYRLRYDYLIEDNILNLFVIYNRQREVDIRYARVIIK